MTDQQPIGANLPPANSYIDYQKAEELLGLQVTRSQAPDEHVFLTVAQAMELMYKAAYHECVIMRGHLAADRVDEAVTLGDRVARLIRLAADSWEVYDTITPQGFLAFRSVFGTGSGFQSPSYRLLEFALGNRNVALAKRHLQNIPWAWPLVEHEITEPSLWDESNRLLSRRGHVLAPDVTSRDWSEEYRVSEAVEAAWREVYQTTPDPQLIRLGERLIDIAERFSEFRYKHLLVVERTMGWRPGTGGTTGVDWLRTIAQHRFFPELWLVRTTL